MNCRSIPTEATSGLVIAGDAPATPTRIVWFRLSATNTLPAPSTVTLEGELKWAALPLPSVLPVESNLTREDSDRARGSDLSDRVKSVRCIDVACAVQCHPRRHRNQKQRGRIEVVPVPF